MLRFLQRFIDWLLSLLGRIFGSTRPPFTLAPYPVLVAGGDDGAGSGTTSSGNPTASAEIYDPGTGRFTPTATPMTVTRNFHAAVRLRSGQVLLTGGMSRVAAKTNYVSSAELFDHGSRSFTPAGQMTEARGTHTMTLLSAGNVLIAGGGSPVPLASAELYDPQAGAFAPTGAMGGPRALHTATLLRHGVLVSGGTSSIRDEIYAQGQFSATDSGHPYWHQAAALLRDGRVLILGGAPDGGSTSYQAVIFDPATGTATSVGGLYAPRAQFTATTLADGRVLIAGGIAQLDHPETALDSIEIFDPAMGLFSHDPNFPMRSKRYAHTATLLADGKVLLAGGRNGQFALNSAEIYDPSTNRCTFTGAMGTARLNHTATALLT